MRTVFSEELWTLEALDDAVQNVLMRDIANPASPAEDIEIPGRDIPAKPLG
jgi:hypothetical protein